MISRRISSFPPMTPRNEGILLGVQISPPSFPLFSQDFIIPDRFSRIDRRLFRDPSADFFSRFSSSNSSFSIWIIIVFQIKIFDTNFSHIPSQLNYFSSFNSLSWNAKCTGQEILRALVFLKTKETFFRIALSNSNLVKSYSIVERRSNLFIYNAW